MIYSTFGAEAKITKVIDERHVQIAIREVRGEGEFKPLDFEYDILNLRADDGMNEIQKAMDVLK